MNHQTAYMNTTTSFGKWLLNEMVDNELTCADVARRLKMTRQSVRNHVVGDVKPSFACVIAYCWLFNCIEKLDNIWNLVTDEEP